MTPAEQNIALRRQIGLGMGLSDFDGTPHAYRSLSPSDQITLTNRMKAWIRAHPSDFTAQQVKIASSPDIGPIEDYTWLDAAETFGSEMLNQAEEINPFSQRNRTQLVLTLTLIAAVGVAVFAYVKAKPPAP